MYKDNSVEKIVYGLGIFLIFLFFAETDYLNGMPIWQNIILFIIALIVWLVLVMILFGKKKNWYCGRKKRNEKILWCGT